MSGAEGAKRQRTEGASTVAVGDAIPAGIELHHGFPPQKINLAEHVAGKNVIIMGLPGAFTPT